MGLTRRAGHPTRATGWLRFIPVGLLPPAMTPRGAHQPPVFRHDNTKTPPASVGTGRAATRGKPTVMTPASVNRRDDSRTASTVPRPGGRLPSSTQVTGISRSESRHKPETDKDSPTTDDLVSLDTVWVTMDTLEAWAEHRRHDRHRWLGARQLVALSPEVIPEPLRGRLPPRRLHRRCVPHTSGVAHHHTSTSSHRSNRWHTSHGSCSWCQ